MPYTVPRFTAADPYDPHHTLLNKPLPAIENGLNDLDTRTTAATRRAVDIVGDQRQPAGSAVILPSNANFMEWPGEAPEAIKHGATVILAGAWRCQVAGWIGTVTERLVLTLPAAFRPLRPIRAVMQGSASNLWLMVVGTDGRVTASRYTETAHAAGVWMPFYLEYRTATYDGQAG